MDPKHERAIKNVNTTKGLRNLCKKNDELKKGLQDSLDPPKELIKQAMNRLSLKDKSFKIYNPSTHDTIASYVKELKVFGFDNVDIETSNDTLKCT